MTLTSRACLALIGLAIILLAAGCAGGGSGATPIIVYVTPGPVATGASTVSPGLSGRTDAEIVAEMRDTIDLVYCGEDPKPDWCPGLTVTDAGYDVAVVGSTLAVGTHAMSDELAEDLCHALAAAHFDANAQDLGFRHVMVIGPGQKVVAECDIP